MRIPPKHIEKLKLLVKDQLGLDYDDEQAQEAGMAILRFVKAKRLKQSRLDQGDIDIGDQDDETRPASNL